jgi:hypothetical protein
VHAGQTGQASIELIGVFPLLIFAALACVQALLLAITLVSVEGATGAAASSIRAGQSVERSDLRLPTAIRQRSSIRIRGEQVRVRAAVPSVIPGLDRRLTVQSEAALT